jgi:galactosylceramidase
MTNFWRVPILIFCCDMATAPPRPPPRDSHREGRGCRTVHVVAALLFLLVDSQLTSSSPSSSSPSSPDPVDTSRPGPLSDGFFGHVSAGASSPYPIDTSRPGPIFDGFGHVSAGASSRLLFSYPEPHLSSILDLLFTPSYGLATQILKVELGGDGQSTDGVEACHLRSETEAPNYARGYEWRLMAAARQRNPSIKLAALAWVWPAWVGNGTRSPWTNVTKSVNYIVSWLEGARDAYNLSVDFLDADWNERGWSSTFVKALRPALDAAGFPETKIVCGDDAHVFSCAAEVAADPELAAAVYALGSHNPSVANGPPPQPPTGPAKQLWGSELEVADPGGTDTPPMVSGLLLGLNTTGFLVWALVTAYYEGLFAWDQGAFRTHQPWSGFYSLSGRVWAVAHYTQNTSPGWRILPSGVGSGVLSLGGTYVTFLDPPSGGLTVVVHKPLSGSSPETATFQLLGPAARALSSSSSLVVWLSQTQEGEGADLSRYYIRQPNVTVSASGEFSLTLSPGDLVTVTTVTSGRKGAPPVDPPPAAPFPATYADDFSACVPDQEADFWTDMTGAWECVADFDPEHGTVMQQRVPAAPIAWRPDEKRPLTVVGDLQWRSANVTLDLFMAAGETATVGVRANPGDGCCGGRIITGEDLMPGLWLALAAGSGNFTVFNAVENVTTAAGVLLSGVLGGGGGSGGGASPPAAGVWHRVSLAVTAEGVAAAELDGASIFAGLNVQGLVPDTGFVGTGTWDWGSFTAFDNVRVEAGE